MKRNNPKSKVKFPIRYRPFPKQERFHRDRYVVSYRGIFAGTGSGKTFAGVFEDLSWAMENPGSVGIIFEPTYNMIQRILIRQTLEHPRFLDAPLEANPLVHSYSKTELRLELNCPEPHGDKTSTIYFLSLDKPETAEGSSIDWAHIDEARLVPKFGEAWESVLRRLRGSGRSATNNVGAWVTTTPDFPGSYLYNFFEDPRTKDPQSQSYHWSLHDNIHVSEEYKRSVARNHTGALHEIFVDGRFAVAGTLTFGFDSALHVLHKLPCKDQFREMVYGVDWGWTNPACVLAVGMNGDGRAYVVDEFYERRATLETLIEAAEKMMERWGRGTFYCDRSEPGSIDSLVQDGLDAVADNKSREDGIREVGGRFPVAGDGRPRIYILSSCVNLIAELLVYDEKRKRFDHAVDALRYALVNHEDLSGEIDISFAKRP